MKTYALLIAFTILLAQSCKKDEPVIYDPGYAYFPIVTDSYVAYDVDSIVFDIPSGIQDTFHFQVKEKVDSTFFDLQGRPAARIERFYRGDTLEPWNLQDVWVANRTIERAEKVEENVRFVKMAFPVEELRTWDGNSQNTIDPWNYTYQDIDQPRTVGVLDYERTVTVGQRDISNLIEEEFSEEIYAYGVGMVYKQLDTLKYSLSGGVRTLQTGIKFKMTAFEYGEE